jgi:DNA-binding SARP family transcriptional activator/tetratricopeptide (TPR) repeat protein
MLSIQLLGAPLLFLDGRPLSVPRRKSRALLFYLAARTTPPTRDHLLALLWPDHDRPAAQQILRTSLHGLRKALGPALIVGDDTLSLAPDTDLDIRRFEAGLAATAELETLAAALALYRDDFLADFSVPDAEAFEAWADAERERYRQLATHGLATLAQRYQARQDYPAAREALARALAFNPLQEDLQRAALRLDYLSGDRAGAIRRYESLRRLLDDEFGVPPMDETRALYDAIITDSLPVGSQQSAVGSQPASKLPTANRRLPTGVLPFTGRAAELQQLRELSSTRKLALIEGEPGIGKTRLADAFIQEFDGLALIGAARELEQALPYQPVIEALRGLLARPEWPALHARLSLPRIWRAEAARLLPELAEHGVDQPDETALPSANESRLWEGVSQLLQALARRRPLLLLLDDLHWADASTLALLGYLVRQTQGAPITFLATARPAEPRSPLAALLQTLTREDRLQRLPLRRLSNDDTVALAQHLSATYAYPLADWLARNAEGNPYIVAELVRYAREHKLLRSDGTLNLSALSETPVVPHSVYSLIQSRLLRLSDAARRVLDVAVAVGREFDLDIVARASGLSESAVLDALDELRATALVAPIGAADEHNRLRYGFDHTLTMEVAYREIGEARHRLTHRHIAEALEQLHAHDLDAVAGLLVSHFAEGNAPDRAAQYALRAGRRAAELAAWAEAIAFYEIALAGMENGRREATYLALADAYSQSGAAARAGEAYRAAIELAGARGDIVAANRTRLALGRTLLAQARYAEAIALAERVLAADQPENTVGAEMLWGSALSIEGVDLAGATAHLNKAASLCSAQQDPTILAQTTFELGSIAAQQGDLVRAIELYRRALAVGEAYPAAAQYRILAHNNLAYHLLLLGDPTAAEHAKAGLEIARASGVLSFQPYLLSTLGEIALADGDLDAAEASFNEGLDLAERLPIPERIAGLTANLALVSIKRGQTALAIHHLSTALARADALGTRHLAAQIRIWLAPLLPPAEAHATLAEARALAESGNRTRLLEQIHQLELKIVN